MYVRVMNRSEKIEKLANRPTLGFYESIALHCIVLYWSSAFSVHAIADIFTDPGVGIIRVGGKTFEYWCPASTTLVFALTHGICYPSS
jgi:hypothetical protein